MSEPSAGDLVVHVQNVSKRYGATQAIVDMTLHVGSGEIMALLGPSGCGKSTLLAAIAGLVRIDGGSIALADRPVSGPGLHVDPQDRRVGLVFQDHALFPHKSVADNVGFGLHGLGRAERRQRVAQLLDLVQLSGKGHRYPHELSGGESQRVALARALAPSPDVLLLDEPFASLDPTLRAEVRADVRALLRSVGTAAVMVTHDIEDALAVSDRLAVVRAGRIVQVDTPDAIHRSPVDEQVARIFGPVTALAVSGTAAAPMTVLGPVATDAVLRWESGPVALLRPHSADVSADAGTPGGGAVGTVRDRQFVGHGSRLVIALDDGVEVIADVAPEAPHRIGQRVIVRHQTIRRHAVQ